MKVILLVCVLTVTCDCYDQHIKTVVSEEVTKEEKVVSEDKKIEEENLQGNETVREDFWKLNNNNTNNTLINDFAVQEGTKLGIIVVPDLPEDKVDLEYQSQHFFEVIENVTSTGPTVVSDTNILTDNEILTTVANLEEAMETSTFLELEPLGERKYNKSLSNDVQNILETTTKRFTTADSKRNPEEMVKPIDTEDQDNKDRRFLTHESTMKKFERRTFNPWNLLDFGEEKHGSIVKITKEVPYPVPYPVEKKVPFPVKVEVNRPIPIEVPKPYPITLEKNVFYPVREYVHAPYPVFRKLPYLIQITVDKPIPFHIPKPYPVYIEKKVPYPVEKQIPIPIKIPVDQPKPVHIPFVRNFYYPIEKKVHYPVPISVEKPVAVPVERPYPIYIEKKVPTPVEEHFPYPIHVEDSKVKSGISQNYDFQKENIEMESFQNQKTEHIGTIGTHGNSEYEVNGGGFAPLSLLKNDYDHTSFQKKKDSEPQESKKEEMLQESVKTQQPLKKDTTEEKENTSKTEHDFGKKIQNM